MEANAEYKKETVTVMMTAFGTWNVEKIIAKAKIFQLVPTAALTLFQVRRSKHFLCYENEIIAGKGLSKDVTYMAVLCQKKIIISESTNEVNTNSTIIGFWWFSVGICKYETGYKAHDLL